MSDSHFAHHVFFCLNQREPGEGCCADCGSLKAFEYTKARVKALGLAGPGKVRVQLGVPTHPPGRSRSRFGISLLR